MDRVIEHLTSSSTMLKVVIIDSNKDLPENWREQLNEMEGKVKLDEKWESFLDKREQDSENAKEDEDVNNVEDVEDNNIDGGEHVENNNSNENIEGVGHHDLWTKI